MSDDTIVFYYTNNNGSVKSIPFQKSLKLWLGD